MSKVRGRLAGFALLMLASVAIAQSPGSVESHLSYARDYMKSQSWDYAMWAYKDALSKDPDNAEAREGFEKAKALYEAKEAASKAQAQALSQPAPQPAARAPAARKPAAAPAARKPGGQSRPASSARAKCDQLYGTCHAIYKSVATCAPRRAMCYTQNGVK